MQISFTKDLFSCVKISISRNTMARILQILAILAENLNLVTCADDTSPKDEGGELFGVSSLDASAKEWNATTTESNDGMSIISQAILVVLAVLIFAVLFVGCVIVGATFVEWYLRNRNLPPDERQRFLTYLLAETCEGWSNSTFGVGEDRFLARFWRGGRFRRIGYSSTPPSGGGIEDTRYKTPESRGVAPVRDNTNEATGDGTQAAQGTASGGQTLETVDENSGAAAAAAKGGGSPQTSSRSRDFSKAQAAAEGSGLPEADAAGGDAKMTNVHRSLSVHSKRFPGKVAMHKDVEQLKRAQSAKTSMSQRQQPSGRDNQEMLTRSSSETPPEKQPIKIEVPVWVHDPAGSAKTFSQSERLTDEQGRRRAGDAARLLGSKSEQHRTGQPRAKKEYPTDAIELADMAATKRSGKRPSLDERIRNLELLTEQLGKDADSTEQDAAAAAADAQYAIDKRELELLAEELDQEAAEDVSTETEHEAEADADAESEAVTERVAEPVWETESEDQESSSFYLTCWGPDNIRHADSSEEDVAQESAVEETPRSGEGLAEEVEDHASSEHLLEPTSEEPGGYQASALLPSTPIDSEHSSSHDS